MLLVGEHLEDFSLISRKDNFLLLITVEFRIMSFFRSVKFGSKVFVEDPSSSPILKEPKKPKVHRNQKLRMSTLFSESLLIATLVSLKRLGVIGSLVGVELFEQKSNFFFPDNS